MNSQVVITAFEARPAAATEAGLAWNWAREYRRLGYTPTVISQRHPESDADAPVWEAEGITYMPVGKESKVGAPQGISDMISLYSVYKRWCSAASIAASGIDAAFIQHLSLSSLRLPVPEFRGSARKVIGPVGGAQNAVFRGTPIQRLPHEVFRASGGRVLELLRRRRQIAGAAYVLATNAPTRSLARKCGYTGQSMLGDGIDEQHIAPNENSRAPDAPLRLGWAGRMVGSKRPDLALRILSQLLADGYEADLMIAGDGPELLRMRRLAEQLGVSSRCRFLGHVGRADMIEYYDRIDILLHHSMRESGCPAVVEAAARGVPTVGLRVHALAHSVPFIVARGPSRFPGTLAYANAAASFVKTIASPVDYGRASAAALEFARANTWSVKARTVAHGIVENWQDSTRMEMV